MNLPFASVLAMTKDMTMNNKKKYILLDYDDKISSLMMVFVADRNYNDRPIIKF